MSSRIRYSKLSDSRLQSVKTFSHPTNGARYKVVLDLAANQWLVIEDTTSLLAASGHNNTLHNLKLDAKNALVELGVPFSKESRKKEVTQEVA
jgi:hypothetical protein